MTTRRWDGAPYVFRDTITARMLRTLCDVERMPQAEFMALYHVRAERPEPSRSSFFDQFGRFTRGELRCIDQLLIDPAKRERMWAQRKLLQWRGPNRVELIKMLTSNEWMTAFGSLERQMLEPRKTDDVSETWAWLKSMETRTHVQKDGTWLTHST